MTKQGKQGERGDQGQQGQPMQDKRRDDNRITNIESILESFERMFNGDGFDDPGLKGMIRDMNRTLHGNKDETGLVGMVKDHSIRIDKIEKIKVFGVAFGVIIVGLVGWGKSIKEFLVRFIGL